MAASKLNKTKTLSAWILKCLQLKCYIHFIKKHAVCKSNNLLCETWCCHRKMYQFGKGRGKTFTQNVSRKLSPNVENRLTRLPPWGGRGRQKKGEEGAETILFNFRSTIRLKGRAQIQFGLRARTHCWR